MSHAGSGGPMRSATPGYSIGAVIVLVPLTLAAAMWTGVLVAIGIKVCRLILSF